MTAPFLTHPALDTPRIAHGFFTRQGGTSTGIYKSLNCGPGSQDVPENVRVNRHRVIAALGIGELATVHQIHSADVYTVRGSMPAERPKADALVTKMPGMILGILTADCGPVLFVDNDARVIGAAHAGWKGALTGVLENTVAAMEKLGAQRGRIVAVLGPCIAQASYEVGTEFYERLVAADTANTAFFVPPPGNGRLGGGPGGVPTAPDSVPLPAPPFQGEEKWMFDLSGYVLARLRATGIAKVDAIARDTCAEPEFFFSYRRTTLRGEADYGRQISAITLK